ncbi:hypothetical protein MRX96_055905 [Rhipicephalus microplus]
MAAATLSRACSQSREGMEFRRRPTPYSNENNAGAVERRRTLPQVDPSITCAKSADYLAAFGAPVLDERMSRQNVMEGRQGHPYPYTRARPQSEVTVPAEESTPCG